MQNFTTLTSGPRRAALVPAAVAPAPTFAANDEETATTQEIEFDQRIAPCNLRQAENSD